MESANYIIGFAMIKDKKMVDCSKEVQQIISEIGTEWASNLEYSETPLTIKLGKYLYVKVFQKSNNKHLAVFLDGKDWTILKERQLELEAIYNHSHDGVYLSDGDGITLGVSHGTERNFGVKSSYLIGKNVKDLEKEGIFQPSVVRLVLEKQQRVTVSQKTKAGKVLIATGNPIFNEENEIVRVVCNSRDITELIQLKEEIKEKEEIVERYKNELMRLRLKETAVEGFITNSPIMEEVLRLLKRVAPFDSTVLITGESGTGKGIIAKNIHNLSSKKGGPFIKVDCGMISENLLESELFGYEDGAFTGARKGGKPGYFELAQNGTLFLDEIGELPLSLQAKLLQAIQDKTIQRVGGTRTIQIDFRLIAATNRNLDGMVKSGQFREDLFYRLNVIPIHIPPLRERTEDIPFLIHFFLNKFNHSYKLERKLDAKSVSLLSNYEWPGNVRQLKNVIERLVILSEDDKINETTIQHLFQTIEKGTSFSRPKDKVEIPESNVSKIDNFEESIDLNKTLKEIEKNMIEKALRTFKSTRKAAKHLKMSQSTLVRRTKEYNITV